MSEHRPNRLRRVKVIDIRSRPKLYYYQLATFKPWLIVEIGLQAKRCAKANQLDHIGIMRQRNGMRRTGMMPSIA